MKKRSPIHAYKRLLDRDQDWDFAFLIALEKKLQRMHDYFKYQGHPEVNRMAPRDIAICIRLIDIFMQDVAAFNTWLHKSFSDELKWRKLEDGMYELDDSNITPLADFPVYVNVRNERRFFRTTPIKDAQQKGDKDGAFHLITRLRQEKALHLYHLIREYKLLSYNVFSRKYLTHLAQSALSPVLMRVSGCARCARDARKMLGLPPVFR